MTTTTDLARNTAFVATYADEVTIRLKDIKQLAVRYAAFMEAASAGQFKTAQLWAGMLNDTQKDTGVTIVGDDLLRDYLPR